MIRRALYSPAVYEAAATIQIEDTYNRSGLVTELTAFESIYSVESELEVMRSFDVAQAAAADPTSGARAQVIQQHAHRPLEVFLRPLLRRPEPIKLGIRAEFPDKASYGDVAPHLQRFGSVPGDPSSVRGPPRPAPELGLRPAGCTR